MWGYVGGPPGRVFRHLVSSVTCSGQSISLSSLGPSRTGGVRPSLLPGLLAKAPTLRTDGFLTNDPCNSHFHVDCIFRFFSLHQPSRLVLVRHYSFYCDYRIRLPFSLFLVFLISDCLNPFFLIASNFYFSLPRPNLTTGFGPTPLPKAAGVPVPDITARKFNPRIPPCRSIGGNAATLYHSPHSRRLTIYCPGWIATIIPALVQLFACDHG